MAPTMPIEHRIEHRIDIAADRQKVWRAITKPEHFSNWFGDTIHFSHLAAGEPIAFEVGSLKKSGTIERVEVPDLYAFHWTPEPGEPARTLVTFRLEAVGSGTRVTVTEEGFEALPDKVRAKRYDLHKRGWPYQMGQLEAYVQSEPDV